MSVIRVLDSLTANKIAAGEVVERPVSVVKELLENAIDAGSTRIKIDILESGFKRIEVSDNGNGMVPEDSVKAIQRHATSKIRGEEDLNHLTSLGFRGEALPSIAAVSKLLISTRTVHSTEGCQILVINGQIKESKELGRPVGTTVTVDDLFYNTPPRKKFLKTPSTELGHITDMVGRIALSQPNISFELNHDGKKLLQTSGNNDLLQTIFSVYGSEIARNMALVNLEETNKKIFGYITLPNVTRSSRHFYNFFVNGRYVKSQELASILEEAFYTRIPAKKYPVAVIHLSFSPEFFDVNVHPAKLEIKFKDLSLVKESFNQALKSVFPDQVSRVTSETRLIKPIEVNKVAEQTAVFNPNSMETGKEDSVSPISDSDPLFSSLKVMGQLNGTYIIATGEEGIYIIDQHAAHERIRYEKIKRLFFQQPSASLFLAVPIFMELTHQQSLWLINSIVKLTNLGFVVEHFGDNTFLLRGVPKWNVDGNSEELLLALLEKLGNEPELFSLDKIAESEIFSLACKSSVKANRLLTESDINYLLQQLDITENPYSCPHGRPVIIKVTLKEIQKRFLRI